VSGANVTDSDEDAQFGPPDKQSNFNKNRKHIDFDSDSDVVPPAGKGVRRLLSKE